jgi:hypothetical protein
MVSNLVTVADVSRKMKRMKIRWAYATTDDSRLREVSSKRPTRPKEERCNKSWYDTGSTYRWATFLRDELVVEVAPICC